jgi:hypothetical protein
MWLIILIACIIFPPLIPILFLLFAFGFVGFVTSRHGAKKAFKMFIDDWDRDLRDSVEDSSSYK